ncbi:MAG: hypothetical protein JSV86_03530 [Gemmatimonadota bacterium]|nr:MAG: hypothetical protein JSV86_03530 [Gemmatimonadota bacterium]
MYSLRLLGVISLEDESGPLSGRVTQARRLALLALLGAAGHRGWTRDKLLGFLWPDASDDRARHLLSDSLYVIRQALGEEGVIAASGVVRLNSEAVWTDVVAFEERLTKGELSEAVELYAGPFLDGFYVNDAVEFEHWLDGERDRLARLYAKALETLAQQAEEAGDSVQALEWWRKLAGHAPYDSRIALRLMEAFVAVGNPGGALEHARLHETLVRENLGRAPSSELRSCAEMLIEVPMPVRKAGTASATTAATGEEAHASLRQPVVETARPAQWWDNRKTRATVVLAGVMLALVMAAAVVPRVLVPDAESPPAAPDAISRTSVAVFPFTVHASDSLFLREALGVLLYQALDGAGELRGVDPNALFPFHRREGAELSVARAAAVSQRFGAGSYILGRAIDVAGELRVTITLYDVNRGGIATAGAAAEGPRETISALVDTLAVRLLSDYPPASGVRLSDIRSLHAKSYAALKAYLEGESAIRARDYAGAVAAFDRAIAADSGFVLAWYRRIWPALWAGRGAEESLRRAWLGRELLSKRDQRGLEAFRAVWLGGDGSEARRLTAEFVGLYSGSVEAWWLRALALLWYNWQRGRSMSEARDPLERALQLDPGFRPAFWDLSAVAAFEGRHAEADSSWRRWVTPDMSSFWFRLGEAHSAFSVGDAEAQDSVVAALTYASDGLVNAAALNVATILPGDLRGAIRLAELLTDPERRSRVTRAAGYLHLAHMEAGLGHWKTATAHFGQAERLAPATALAFHALIAALSFLDVPGSELAALRQAVTRWDGTFEAERARLGGDVLRPFAIPDDLRPHMRTYLLAILAARLGDRAAALAHARTLERHARQVGDSLFLIQDLTLEVEAAAALAAGDSVGALRTLERAQYRALPGRGGVFGSSFWTRFYGRYLRAELLYSVGRDQEALGWFRSFGWFWGTEYIYHAPAHLRRAQLHERLGNRDQAMEHYRRFAELWNDCDPRLRPTVERVRVRLAQR